MSGLDQVTIKESPRAEPRKTQGYADAQFARFVGNSILRAVRDGARTFGELLLDLPSIYPTDVLGAIDQMPRLSKMEEDVLGKICEDARMCSGEPAASESLLPLPHPLDYEWRFSAETRQALLAAALDLTRNGESIFLYGTPGLAYAAILRPLPDRKVLFVSPDTAVTRRLLRLNEAKGNPISIAIGRSLEKESASAILVDPPWYPDYLNSMLHSAALACRFDGVILASLPPIGIRPGVVEERDALERFAEEQGLERVTLDPLALSYQTPFFEENALAAVGVYAPAVWRRGDLAVYRRRTAPRDEWVVQEPISQWWLEVEINRMRVRIRLDTGVSSPGEKLQSLVYGDVLPTVSRRDPLRAQANIWTSGNRVFRVGDPILALEAAYACNDGAAHSILRNPVDGAFDALVDRLRQIARIEAEELERSRGGIGSLLWRAA